MKKQKFTAIYVRVSTTQQSTRSQRPDLVRWVQVQPKSTVIRWFTDKASGKTMNRPAWNKLQAAIDSNRVSRLVVWRLDRLGRTASGLTKLFENLQARKVNLISIKDGIDLSTTAGRLIANVLASVAAYEIEVSSERIRAGQAAPKAKGKRWGGSKKGCLHKVSIEQVKAIVQMKANGAKLGLISRTTGVPTYTIPRIIQRVREGFIRVT